MLKAQGGSLGAFRMAVSMVRKYGTIQLTGVYGLVYSAFPLGELFERNITLKWGWHRSFITCRAFIKC